MDRVQPNLALNALLGESAAALKQFCESIQTHFNVVSFCLMLGGSIFRDFSGDPSPFWRCRSEQLTSAWGCWAGAIEWAERST